MRFQRWSNLGPCGQGYEFERRCVQKGVEVKIDDFLKIMKFESKGIGSQTLECIINLKNSWKLC